MASISANGRLTDAELTTVQFGRLSNTTAAAWNIMVAAAARDGVSLVIAGGTTEGGSGAYRDYFTQGDMRVRPWLYGLSTYSTVSIAAAGYSTHGWGTAVDIGSFPPASNTHAYGAEGAARRDWALTNAARFGFTRTFGEADPNHFGHDGSSTSTAGNGTTPLEIDMPLDANDQAFINGAVRQAINEITLDPQWLNKFGDSVIAQTVEKTLAGTGEAVWGANLRYTTTDEPPRTFDGTARDWIVNMSDALGRVKMSGTSADYSAFAAELHKTLPAEVVAAIKAAL